MADLSALAAALKCICDDPQKPLSGAAETLMSEELGIPLIDAHKLFDTFEDYITRVIDLPDFDARWERANSGEVDHTKVWEQNG